jgi:hypothetical protein
MKWLIKDLEEKDKLYILNTIKFTQHQTFDEKFEFAGNFAITSTYEQWEEECRPCCGTRCFTIKCPSGRRVFFCFDFGH